MKPSTRAAAALAPIVAAVTACSGAEPSPDENRPAGTSATSKAAQPTAADEPSDESPVVIEDSGLTAFPEQQGSGGYPFINVAIVVQNPSVDWAWSVRVSVEFVDGDGQIVPAIDDVDSGEATDTVELEITAIAPGATQAVTSHISTEQVGAVSLDAEVHDASYYPADNEDLQAFEVSEPDDVTADGAGLGIDFTVTSPFEEERAGHTYAVFRNAAGEIVGGSHRTDASDYSYLPGSNETSIDASGYGMPPDVDPDTIGIYATPTF